MHKIFIAQMCACRVLNLATIRSKYYFNFILNRTRSGREMFDRPSEVPKFTAMSCDVRCPLFRILLYKKTVSGETLLMSSC